MNHFYKKNLKILNFFFDSNSTHFKMWSLDGLKAFRLKHQFSLINKLLIITCSMKGTLKIDRKSVHNADHKIFVH